MLTSPTKMTDIKPTKPSEMLDLWVELKPYFMESISLFKIILTVMRWACVNCSSGFVK